MINSLYIRNYALIDELEMRFSDGFTTITGETGAGKSILMGALSLILGQRADSTVLKLKDAKCIVEGTFNIGEGERILFDDHDIDFDSESTIRREISPGGKSRTFINDTPVNLPLLKEIGTRLVDIHSQHQNLQLNDHSYQLGVIDYLGDTSEELEDYRTAYSTYLKTSQELEKVREAFLKMKEDMDFMLFQFDELRGAHLKIGELEVLESEIQRAEHQEEIRNAHFHSVQLFSMEHTGILDQLKEVLSQQQKISKFYTPSKDLAERIEEAYIELKDISAEVDNLAEKSDMEPGKLDQLQERIDLLFSLMQKHRVNSAEELIQIRDLLDQKLTDLSFSDEKISKLEAEITGLLSVMERYADILHLKRSTAGEEMQQDIENQLKQLGIPNARFRVEIERKKNYDHHGSDDIRFLFSANKQMPLEEIASVASGGEISRLMLCIKSLVSNRKGLPTLIFDEIDAGVSGEIADKVGGIMDQLARGRQVLAITHLPQVASRGSDHFVVYKEDTKDATYTRIRKLNREERVSEIAKMLSGKKITDAALSNARELLRV